MMYHSPGFDFADFELAKGPAWQRHFHHMQQSLVDLPDWIKLTVSHFGN
jgi:predicted cupin superfamily sugar epimerase